MKLIIELFLIFAPLNLCQIKYINEGELQQYKCGKLIPDDGRYRAYYINTSSFDDKYKLYFKIIMNNGSFSNTKMKYFYADNKTLENISDINIANKGEEVADSYSRTSPNFTTTNFYTNETYYYSINKNGTHLYIVPPTGYSGYYYKKTTSYITVCSLKKKGISIELWIGAGAFVLVAFILIIVFYKYKRAPKQKYIDTTVVEPIVINASPSSNTSYQND